MQVPRFVIALFVAALVGIGVYAFAQSQSQPQQVRWFEDIGIVVAPDSSGIPAENAEDWGVIFWKFQDADTTCYVTRVRYSNAPLMSCVR